MWIQITSTEATELQENGCIQPNSGYWYNDENCNEMVGLHVDTCKEH